MQKLQNNDEIALIRTNNDSKKLTISSRALFQKTSNHNTTETYRYDPDGRLTAAEADVKTWEERNTEIYRWLNDDRPPFERFQTTAALPQPQRRRGDTEIDDDAGLIRMSSTVHSVPPLRWSGTNTDRVIISPDQVRERTASIDGRQRSQSEHCVRMESSIRPVEMRGGNTGKAFHPRLPPPPSKLVWAPPKTPWLGKVGGSGTGSGGSFDRFSNGPGLFRAVSMGSLAERHSRRCMENRKRRALQYRQGIDY